MWRDNENSAVGQAPGGAWRCQHLDHNGQRWSTQPRLPITRAVHLNGDIATEAGKRCGARGQ